MATHHRGRAGRGNQAVGGSRGPARYRRTRAASAQVLLVAVLMGACENPLAPVSCGSIPEQTVPEGKSVSLRVCFNDENGDPVSLSAKSSNRSVLTVSVAGRTLTVTGEGPGKATVTVTARDPGGSVGTVSFPVWVPMVVRLTDDGYYPAWSPDGGRIDGGRIAFVGVSRDYSYELYVMNAYGGDVTRLTGTSTLHGYGYRNPPVWSPDGSRIAFQTDFHSDNAEIYVINADGSGETNLTNNPGRDANPAWSPDGGRIAFESDRDGNSEIYVINADGSGVTNLTNTPGDSERFPAWSPDGSRIVFDSYRDRSGEIYVMNADGSGATNLTNTPGDSEHSPAWSPDGSRIVFLSYRGDGHHGVYVMNADGSGETRLMNIKASGSNSRPAWSPDGSRIAFHSARNGSLELSVMNADGTGAANLSVGGFHSWSPDGRRIVFSCESVEAPWIPSICLVNLSEVWHR